MKKVLLGVFLLGACASAAFAEGYNRVGLSYDNTRYSFNKDYDDDLDGVSTNGFGIDYIHGFSLSSSTPIFLEAGLNLNFGFGGTDVGEKVTYQNYWMQGKVKYQNINLQIPVNFVYKFDLGNDMSLAPYVGLNFKFNLVSKKKSYADHNIPDSMLDDDDKKDFEGEWVNLFSSDDDNMGDKDYTWNRFQMGWHVGVGFQYTKFYFGIQYGTDFIPAYSHTDGNWKPKVSTADLKVSLAYCF